MKSSDSIFVHCKLLQQLLPFLLVLFVFEGIGPQ